MTSGHPYFSFFNSKGRFRQGGHEFSFVLNHGPLPAGKIVLHKCHNSECVRGSHLYAGTYSENIKDDFSAGKRPNKSRRLMTKEQVRELRRLADGGGHYKDLAKKFGVSPVCALEAILRTTYKNVRRSRNQNVA
jgi:hypothetical protein